MRAGPADGIWATIHFPQHGHVVLRQHPVERCLVAHGASDVSDECVAVIQIGVPNWRLGLQLAYVSNGLSVLGFGKHDPPVRGHVLRLQISIGPPGRRRHRHHVPSHIDSRIVRLRRKPGYLGVHHLSTCVKRSENDEGVPVGVSVPGAELDEIPACLVRCLRNISAGRCGLGRPTRHRSIACGGTGLTPSNNKCEPRGK
jgi:hypothetical protein